MLSERHIELLEKRGLDPEIPVRFHVESEDRQWIRIPYFVGDDVVNWKYRTLFGEKRFRQDEGARKTFWNFNAITDLSLADQPLIVTEGELDAFAAIQAGFARVVSVPDGAPAQAVGDDDRGAKYSYVREAEPALRDVRGIVLATDADAPGVNLMNDLALRLGKARCRWVQYPNGCKDLNDVLREGGEAAIRDVIAGARWVRVDGVYRMSELPPITRADALDCGMPGLGDHYRLRLGDFVVLTGIPSHGKTQFVGDLCCRMAEAHGWDTAFASFESTAQTDHRRMLRTWYLEAHPDAVSEARRKEADQWIDRHFTFLVPDEDEDVTVAWLLEKAAAAVLRHGARIVVVDPWNEMDHLRPDNVTREEYTGIAIKQFRRFARKYRVHLIVIAHPTKLHKERSGGAPVPTLYDIADAAHWANKCDVGLVISRSGESTETRLRVAKVRFEDEIGRAGDVMLRLDKARARYVSATEAAEQAGML